MAEKKFNMGSHAKVIDIHLIWNCVQGLHDAELPHMQLHMP